MESSASDAWLGIVFLALLIASSAAWFKFFERLKAGPLIPYRPRRPVPWSGVWIGLPLLLVGSAVYTSFQPELTTGEITAERLALGAAQQVIFVAVFLGAMLLISRPNRSDFGIPSNARELVGDLRLGAIIWIAALAPVYFVRVILYATVSEAPGHPLVTSLMENADTTLLIAAFVTAVVVAPVCEELIFRVLLQGWLEKWEDSELGWRRASVPSTPAAEVAASDGNTDAAPADAGGSASALNSLDVVDANPPQRGLGGLPYGWAPILLSSLLFALAHAGYGTDPIPLFVLSLGLGYVYQRTHSPIPSIAAHAIFNGMSLLALWRLVSVNAQ